MGGCTVSESMAGVPVLTVFFTVKFIPFTTFTASIIWVTIIGFLEGIFSI